MPNPTLCLLPLAKAILDSKPPLGDVPTSWACERWQEARVLAAGEGAAPVPDAVLEAQHAGVLAWPLDFQLEQTLRALRRANEARARSVLAKYSVALGKDARARIPSTTSEYVAKLFQVAREASWEAGRDGDADRKVWRDRAREFNAVEPSQLRICVDCLRAFELTSGHSRDFCSKRCGNRKRARSPKKQLARFLKRDRGDLVAPGDALAHWSGLDEEQGEAAQAKADAGRTGPRKTSDHVGQERQRGSR